MGEVAAKQGKKTAMTITWKYAAGDESVAGFKEGFEKGGGKVDEGAHACRSRTSSSRRC